MEKEKETIKRAERQRELGEGTGVSSRRHIRIAFWQVECLDADSVKNLMQTATASTPQCSAVCLTYARGPPVSSGGHLYSVSEGWLSWDCWISRHGGLRALELA